VYINIYLSSVNTNHNEVNYIPYYLKYIQLIKFNWTKPTTVWVYIDCSKPS